MRRRRVEDSTLSIKLGSKQEVKKTISKKEQPKSMYQNHVENSVKKLINVENKGYEKPTGVKINNGGKKYTFTDLTDPIDLPITDKTNLRFKVVKTEEENVCHVDVRTMVLKNGKWEYTQRGINFELGYIEDVIMNLVELANQFVDEEAIAY